ncbi:lysozyme inhibitor LprI family protein [Metapseudomonas otitidis]|uniref:lysozyme inhibitor LprI family protein n=1 Tax=Metapseudomonas otitidis TaxID=319939 RepID=UPI0013F5C22F|nr:lysozyme inhibitor LprI family protein [Pseudomonas otitidis]
MKTVHNEDSNVKKILPLAIIASIYCSNAHSTVPEFCNSITTRDINSCSDFLLREPDKKLNEKYKQPLNPTPEKYKTILIKSQRLWISYRDKTCKVYQPDSEGKYPDGSHAGNEAYAEKKNCETEITDSRTIELETLLKHGINHAYKKFKKYTIQNNQSLDEEKLKEEIIRRAEKNSYWKKYADVNCTLRDGLK